jgi:hypothetical protein
MLVFHEDPEVPQEDLKRHNKAVPFFPVDNAFTQGIELLGKKPALAETSRDPVGNGANPVRSLPERILPGRCHVRQVDMCVGPVGIRQISRMPADCILPLRCRSGDVRPERRQVRLRFGLPCRFARPARDNVCC